MEHNHQCSAFESPAYSAVSTTRHCSESHFVKPLSRCDQAEVDELIKQAIRFGEDFHLLAVAPVVVPCVTGSVATDL